MHNPSSSVEVFSIFTNSPSQNIHTTENLSSSWNFCCACGKVLSIFLKIQLESHKTIEILPQNIYWKGLEKFQMTSSCDFFLEIYESSTFCLLCHMNAFIFSSWIKQQNRLHFSFLFFHNSTLEWIPHTVT